MEELNQAKLEKPARRLWVRILAGFLAVVMVVSLLMLNSVRVTLGQDAEGDAEKTGAAVLTENAQYLDATTLQRLTQLIESATHAPVTYEDNYKIAYIYIAQGKYDKALPYFDRSIELYDGGDQAVLDDLYMKQGSLHAMLGEYSAMEASFSHVSEECGNYAQMLLLTAQAAIEVEDTDKAAVYLAKYLEYEPDADDIRTVLAQMYYASAQYQNAAVVYGYFIDKNGDEDGSLHVTRGLCYMEAGAYADAVNDFLTAKELGYADGELCDAQCCVCSYLMGDYASSISYGMQAAAGTSQQVSKPDVYYFMGQSAMAVGEYSSALEYFTNAAELDSTRQDADYYAAVCLMALGRCYEAAEEFTALIDDGYSLSYSLYNRAVCYMATGQDSLAIPDLEAVVELNDDAELTAAAQELLGGVS